MIKIHSGNCFLINGKVVELTTTTRQGREEDIKLENQEKYIIPVIQKLLKKNQFIKSKGGKFPFKAVVKYDEGTGKPLKTKDVSAYPVFLVFFEDLNWLETEGIFQEVEEDLTGKRKKNARKVEFRVVLSEYNSWEFFNFDKVQKSEENKKGSVIKDPKYFKLMK
jgi:hypothetical protein